MLNVDSISVVGPYINSSTIFFTIGIGIRVITQASALVIKNKKDAVNE